MSIFLIGFCVLEVFEPEEMGMCCSIFPFPLSSHTACKKLGQQESMRERKREGRDSGEKCVCSFHLCDSR